MNQRREHASKEETFSKWAKWLRLSALTTSQPRTFFSIFFLLHHQTIQTGPEIFYIAMKQSRYEMTKDSSHFNLNLAFALKFVSYPKCSCVVQAGDHPDNSSTSTVWSPAPGWVWCSPDCTSFVEMDSRWFGWRSCSKMSATFSGTRLGTSQSSTSSLRSPSTRCSESSPPLQSEWREWYHAILI